MKPYTSIESRVEAELEAKRSRFLSVLAPIDTEEEAEAIVQEIRRKHRDARHHAYAYRLGDDGLQEKYSDDGEPSRTAGFPIMEILTHAGLTHVICVVTRYFGGTLLGTGGLIRAYGGAAKEALLKASLLEYRTVRELTVTSEYSNYDSLLYLMKSFTVYDRETEYASDVTVSFRIASEEAEDFLRDAEEKFSGNLLIEKGEEAFVPVKREVEA